MTSNPPPPKAGQAQTHTPTQYYWRQCYGMDADTWHWALCDAESQKEGKVSCAYMVLLADYPNGIDGKPVGEQPMPAKIIEALNSHSSLLASHERLKQALLAARVFTTPLERLKYKGNEYKEDAEKRMNEALSTAHSVNNG